MQIVKKLTTAAVTGAMFLNLAAPVLAGSTITITNDSNGRDSDNKAKVELDRTTTVVQTNETKVKNEVKQEGETGENKVQDNIGGDVDLKTGDVDQTVKIMTEAGLNVAEIDDCGCDYDIEIVNEKNGRDSDNKAKVDLDNTKTLIQDNLTKVYNKVKQEGETGENKVKDNLGGDDVSVTTGMVDQDATIKTTAGMNKAEMGGDSDGVTDLDLTNSMNGRDSDNKIKVDLDRDTLAEQVNHAKVYSGLKQEGETGENKVKDNQGDVTLTTGDVDQDAKILNWLGANVLKADECCEIEADLTNEKNGRDSDNKIKIDLGDLVTFVQDNHQKVGNKAKQEGETGENKVKDNNSDDLTTGDVHSDVEIKTEAGSNVIGGDADVEFDFDDSLSLILLLIQVLL